MMYYLTNVPMSGPVLRSGIGIQPRSIQRECGGSVRTFSPLKGSSLEFTAVHKFYAVLSNLGQIEVARDHISSEAGRSDQSNLYIRCELPWTLTVLQSVSRVPAILIRQLEYGCTQANSLRLFVVQRLLCQLDNLVRGRLPQRTNSGGQMQVSALQRVLIER